MSRPLIIFLVSLIMAGKTWGAEEASQEEAAVLVEERESRLTNALMAPFELVPGIIRVVGYPLYSFADYAERTNLPLRVADFFSNDERTAFWYPTARSGGEGGFYGAGASHRKLFGKDLRGSVFGEISPGLEATAKLSLRDPNVFSSPASIGFDANYARRNDNEYFGLGNDSQEALGTDYESKSTRVSVPISFPVSSVGEFQVFGAFTSTMDEDKASTPISVVFPASELAGLGDTIHGGEVGVSFEVDTRDVGGTPGSGEAGRMGISYFSATDDVEFLQGQIGIAKYFEFWKPGRILAFAGQFKFAKATDGSQVPFTMLPKLGGTTELRGFEAGRFRDAVTLLLISEYRYPIWKFADGYMFFEGGRVAPGIEDLSIRGFHPSYGGGVRFRSRTNFFFLFQVAGSSEGPTFAFSFNQAL